MESNYISVFTGSSLSEESCALNFSNSTSFLPKENHFFHEIIHFCSKNHKKNLVWLFNVTEVLMHHGMV